MLMLSVVAPMLSCVCCCLLVSVLSSCVLYAPMHSCICSGSSCVLYVCLLPVCLCFHVCLMIVFVLVSCVLCVCLVPMHSCVWCCLLVSCMSACCLLVCAFMGLLSACLCLYCMPACICTTHVLSCVCMSACCLLACACIVCLLVFAPPPCTSNSNTTVATVVRASIAMYFGLCQQKKTKQKQELMVCTALSCIGLCQNVKNLPKFSHCWPMCTCPFGL